MPWEITIVASQDRKKPLGNREDVVDQFLSALPGSRFGNPPAMPKEWLAQMPPEIRDSLLNRPLQLEGVFEAEEFVIQFYANDLPVIDCIHAEVRGRGNPLPALAAVCARHNWLVIDDSNNAVVNLEAGNSPEWERFRNWRDKVINSLKKS